MDDESLRTVLKIHHHGFVKVKRWMAQRPVRAEEVRLHPNLGV